MPKHSIDLDAAVDENRQYASNTILNENWYIIKKEYSFTLSYYLLYHFVIYICGGGEVQMLPDLLTNCELHHNKLNNKSNAMSSMLNIKPNVVG